MLPPLIQTRRESDGVPSDAPKSVSECWDFPHPPRPLQDKVIGWLEESLQHPERRFLSLEAAVGCGKSPVGRAFSQAEGAYILVPQNSLQQQYLRDWPNMAHLKGSTHYRCVAGTDAHPSCRRSECDAKKTMACPYVCDRNRFYNTQGSMTSYAMFLALLIHGDPESLRHRWIVADESQAFDQAVISASEVGFTDTEFFRMTNRPIPHRRDGYDMEYAVSLMNTMSEGVGRYISGKPETHEIVTLMLLRDAIESALFDIEGGEQWVCDVTEPAIASHPARFYAKPVFPTSFFQKNLSRFNILGMSATPLPAELAKHLYGRRVDTFSVGSPFPVENRRIVFAPVARMSLAGYAKGLPALARAVDRIMANHPEDSGVVHTASFKLAKDLCDSLSGLSKRRVVLHRPNDNREETISRFINQKGSVLLSPSVTEGLDLAGDLGRFNVIAKVPYPALKDPWVMARKEIPGWYDWQTALAIAQASGRTTRNQDDWSTTFILDECFSGLYNSNQKMFPEWFQEALTN